MKIVNINGRVIPLPTGRVSTVHNDGQSEGLINQCMFISLLEYLQNNSWNDLSLHDLRNYAGLDSSTENQVFDINNEYHIKSLEKLSVLFNLTLVFIPITRNNFVAYNGELINVIGNGQNIVRICQFGTYHFQLLLDKQTNEPSNEFSDNLSDDKKPLLWYNEKFHKLSEIDPAILENMLNIIEIQSKISSLEFEEGNLILQHSKLYNQQLDYTSENTVLDNIIKKELFDFYQKQLDESNKRLKEHNELIKKEKENKLKLEKALELLQKKSK